MCVCMHIALVQSTQNVSLHFPLVANGYGVN